jgi:hypothetical protein
MKGRYTIEPKPTVYKTIRFRSQLEACWAHLFDQIGMPWEYEPVQIQGWIPDFRLFGRFLAEVKPVAPEGHLMAFGEFEFFKKAIRNNYTILLGDGPGADFGALVIGAEDCLGAMRFFYDPAQPCLMRSVGGDGAGDPQTGALHEHWERARQAICAPPERSGSWRNTGADQSWRRK